MIDALIAKYLTTHKRLVVPGFGTFIRKDESGKIVFVEFLKKDDSMLVNLISSNFAVTELEARNAIDEFIIGIRSKIAAQGCALIDGLGVMRKNTATGLYELDYDTAAGQPGYTPAGCAPAEEPEQSRSGIQVVDTSRPETPEKTAPHRQDDDVVVMERREEPHEQVIAPPVTHAKQPAEASGQNMQQKWDNLMDSGAPEPVRHKETETQPGKPASRQPQPGRRQKSGHGRAAGKPRPRPQQYGGSRRKKTDLVMIIAVVAALIAIGSIIFGVMTSNDPIKMMVPTDPVHDEVQTIVPDSAATEAGIQGETETATE